MLRNLLFDSLLGCLQTPLKPDISSLGVSMVSSVSDLALRSPGSRDSLLVEQRTRDGKVASSNPGWSGGRIFFFRVNFVCWLLIGVHSTPLLLQWQVKGPGYSAKSAGGRLHLNTHKPASRHSVGTYPETSSHASRHGTLSTSRLTSLSHCGLILAERLQSVGANYATLWKKSAGGKWMVERSPQILASEEKATTTVALRLKPPPHPPPLLRIESYRNVSILSVNYIRIQLCMLCVLPGILPKVYRLNSSSFHF